MLAQFLQDFRNPRTIVMEAQARAANGEIVVHRWSTRAFQTKPADSVALPYLCVLDGDIRIFASIDDSLTLGAVSIKNTGELDAALFDDFGGQAVALALGDSSWARSAFYAIGLRADDAGLVGAGADLRLALRDPLAALNAPLTTATTANGKLVPLGAGTCFNLAPVFLGEDIFGAHYQVHDGAVVSITPKSGGLGVDLGLVSFDLANGKFSINPPPSGEVTADVTFQYGGGVVDVIAALLNRAGVSYDAANFSFWQATCPQTIGVYVDSVTSCRDVIRFVAESVGLRLGAFPDNQVYLWRLSPPLAGTQVLNIGPGDTLDGGLEFVRKITPYAVSRLGYQKNWHPLDKSALFGTGEDWYFIDLMGREWSAVTVTDTLIDADYPVASRMPDGDITETALINQADASAEALRRMTVFGAAVYEFRVRLGGDFIYRLGCTVQVFSPRFGFENGVLGQVVSIDWQPLAGVSEITFWVWK
jgi:hypothetical protein